MNFRGTGYCGGFYFGEIPLSSDIESQRNTQDIIGTSRIKGTSPSHNDISGKSKIKSGGVVLRRVENLFGTSRISKPITTSTRGMWLRGVSRIS